MKTQERYLEKYDDVYNFVKQTLEVELGAKGTVTPTAFLSDDLGLEPIDWYVLVDFIEQKYGFMFDDGDLTLFDSDAPRIDGLVHAVLGRLSYEQPVDKNVLRGVAEVIEGVTGIEPSGITPDKNLVDDLGIDSMSKIQIVIDCENKYDLTITDDAFERIKNIQQLVDYISLHRRASVAA